MKYCLALVVFFLLAASAMAEMVSVNVHAANMHSTSALNKYNIVLQVPLYYPLKVLKRSGEMIKTVDYLGRAGWIHKSVASQVPSAIIHVRQANIRKGPATDTLILFRGKKGVAFKVLQKKGDWLHIQHEGGQKGWIARSLTWGSN